MAINWNLIWGERFNLVDGAKLTLFITFTAVAVGAMLGLIVAIMRLSRRWWLKFPSTVYVEALRGTPMLVQILLFYYGIFPGVQATLDYLGIMPHMNFAPLTGWEALDLSKLDFRRLPAIYSGIVALGLNSGAYLGEIFRGGIQSIDKGQREAALSLGMGNYQVMRYIVLPQAIANALPSICNEFITMIKDSSLVAIIAVPELTYRAMLVAARRYEYFTMYVGIAIMYFALTFPTSRILTLIEGRMRVGQTADARDKKPRRNKQSIREEPQ